MLANLHERLKRSGCKRVTTKHVVANMRAELAAAQAAVTDQLVQQQQARLTEQGKDLGGGHRG
jgi:hypothetical protein